MIRDTVCLHRRDPRWVSSLRELLSKDRAVAPSMYRLFAQDDWMHNPRFPQLVDHAPCEGIAQATLVVAGESLTTVMATPLFLRVRSIPQAPPPAAPGTRTLFPFQPWRRGPQARLRRR